MRVVLIAAISADGKIAEREGQRSLDWTSKEDLKFFVSKTKELGVVVMGRKTFDTIGKPLKDRRTIVMTRSQAAKPIIGVEYTSESPEVLVARLKNEGVESLAIAGGANIYSQFLAAGLITDMYLTIEPVLFGDGVPLASGFGRANLKLVSVSKLGEQAVLLHYQV
jgi:dihydrofolate reductase